MDHAGVADVQHFVPLSELVGFKTAPTRGSVNASGSVKVARAQAKPLQQLHTDAKKSYVVKMRNDPLAAGPRSQGQRPPRSFLERRIGRRQALRPEKLDPYISLGSATRISDVKNLLPLRPCGE